MRWSSPETVAGFARSSPNETLMAYARLLASTAGEGLALDIGCGAARNAVPLAREGWQVIGTDNSGPMLEAAVRRAAMEGVSDRTRFLQASMEHLPVADGVADLVIAHGIWNLAASGAQFRAALREAARASKPGAGLFLFTFSRHTLPPHVTPVDGETFVFTEFANEPQCFLTEAGILEELANAGFERDGIVPLHELNRPKGLRAAAGPPVIWEATFRRGSLGP